MITCYLEGGLGNQLFQYAAGRALALRLGAPLRLETSYFKSTPNRLYELDRFRIESKSATPFYDTLFPFLPRRYGVAKLLRKWGKTSEAALNLPGEVQILLDAERGFDGRFLSVQGEVVLKGFWQSERYFQSVADVIRRDLEFRRPPDGTNREFLEGIRANSSVMLHVRRGDFVHNPSFGTCDLDYYRRAVEKMRSYLRDPHFFIFSDDPEWTLQNLKVDAPCTYITHNTGRQNGEDMRLMSHCDHFIIANSSFSWWGAWLGRNPEKHVIAPGRWFSDPQKSTKDLVPEKWWRL